MEGAFNKRKDYDSKIADSSRRKYEVSKGNPFSVFLHENEITIGKNSRHSFSWSSILVYYHTWQIRTKTIIAISGCQFIILGYSLQLPTNSTFNQSMTVRQSQPIVLSFC